MKEEWEDNLEISLILRVGINAPKWIIIKIELMVEGKTEQESSNFLLNEKRRW